MTARLVACMAIVAAFLRCGTISAADEPPRPNFVVIMADDLGYGDLSCYGSPGYRTPHLDRLAREGLRFTDFHSNGSVCSPTRAALLTGRYQQRSGIDGVILADPNQNRDEGLEPDEVTFAESLQTAGYATGIFGKWHLGYEPRFNPVHQGFDLFRGFVSGNICYQAHLDRMGIADWWHDDRPTPEEGYTTHLITRHALEFISAHRTGPFCCYIAHEAVHSPYQGPEDPPVRQAGKTGDRPPSKSVAQAYGEMAAELDKSVGLIVGRLRELGIEKQTLVLFLSDNGATPQGNNAPLRGAKGSVWEGGHRVPCIAWQPGTIQPGTVTDQTAMTMDIMPTLLQLAQAAPDVDRPLDGVSLVPVLQGKGPLRPRTLFWKAGNNAAVRRGEWKLVSISSGPDRSSSPRLFQLTDDLGEKQDRAAEFPELVKQLMDELLTWQADVAQSSMREPLR